MVSSSQTVEVTESALCVSLHRAQGGSDSQDDLWLAGKSPNLNVLAVLMEK